MTSVIILSPSRIPFLNFTFPKNSPLKRRFAVHLFVVIFINCILGPGSSIFSNEAIKYIFVQCSLMPSLLALFIRYGSFSRIFYNNFNISSMNIKIFWLFFFSSMELFFMSGGFLNTLIYLFRTPSKALHCIKICWEFPLHTQRL